MNKKKKEMYANQAPPEQEEIDDVQQEVDPEMGMQPEMGQGMAMGMGEEALTYEKLTEKAAPIKITKDPNAIDPKVAEIRKKIEIDQAKRRVRSVDRDKGNVNDTVEPSAEKSDTINQRPISQRVPSTSGGAGDSQPPTEISKSPSVGRSFDDFRGGEQPPSKGGGGGFKPSEPHESEPMHPFNQHDGVPYKEQPVYLAAKALSEGRVEDIPNHLLATHWQEIHDLLNNDSMDKELLSSDEVKELEKSLEGASDEEKKVLKAKIRKLNNNVSKTTGNRNLMKQIIERNGEMGDDKKNNFLRSIIFASHMNNPAPASASKSLNINQIDDILKNEGLIKEIFGEGTEESLSQNISKARQFDVDDDQVEDFMEMLKLMPGDALRRFEGGGFESGSDFQEYYFGEDDNGNILRGPLSGPVDIDGTSYSGAKQKSGRARALAKVFLQQGGYDPATGQPLLIQNMTMDHVLDKKGGHDGGGINPNREHRDNFMWINDPVNAVKGATEWPEVFDRLKEQRKKLETGEGSKDIFAELDEIAETESYIPNMYDQFVNQFLGNPEAGAISKGDKKQLLRTLNTNISPDFMEKSLRNQEKLEDESKQLKTDMLEKWRDEEIANKTKGLEGREKTAAEKAIKKQFKDLKKKYLNKTPDGKIGKYIWKTDHGTGEYATPGMNIGAGMDPLNYFTRGGEKYNLGRGKELAGMPRSEDSVKMTPYALYNSAIMKMIKDMQNITSDDPEEQDKLRRQHQIDFMQKVEDNKSIVGDIWKPGKANKRIKTQDGNEIKRHDGNFTTNNGRTQIQPPEGMMPESPGQNYSDIAIEAFQRQLYDAGLLDDDEILRGWERNPLQLMALRDKITEGPGSDDITPQMLGGIFKEFIDED
jgi:hypothetical protein